MNFDDLRDANARRCVESFRPIDDWSPTDWGCALAGEVGELCNLLKKERRGEVVDLLDVAHEIADVAIYLDLLATRLGLDLGNCVRAKFNETSNRIGSEVKL